MKILTNKSQITKGMIDAAEAAVESYCKALAESEGTFSGSFKNISIKDDIVVTSFEDFDITVRIYDGCVTMDDNHEEGFDAYYSFEIINEECEVLYSTKHHALYRGCDEFGVIWVLPETLINEIGECHICKYYEFLNKADPCTNCKLDTDFYYR